jgi:hypothetical protein
MHMQHPYCELDQEDRKVYTAWLRKFVALWALILALMFAVCAASTLDALTTPELRIAPYQQSGLFP